VAELKTFLHTHDVTVRTIGSSPHRSDGGVVQLIQGKDKGTRGGTPKRCCAGLVFPEIQVIDLDAALGRGSKRHSSEFPWRQSAGWAEASGTVERPALWTRGRTG
jgi:hypothetical protein